MKDTNPFLLAQYESEIDPEMAAAAGAAGLVIGVIYLAVIVLMIASMWKIFAKAGKPGWAAIVPIYNIIVLLEIVGRPVWWIVLMLIPFVNIVIFIIVAIDLAKSFGQGGGFAAGLILLSVIFYPILAFGGSQYVGPAAGGGQPA